MGMICREQAAAELTAHTMQRLGYDAVTIDEMGNVLGCMGSGNPRLLFDSHLDTVTVNDRPAWSVDPFGGEIRQGRLYGRGAVDMKCGLAASVFGAYAAKQAGLLPENGAVYVSASTAEEDYDGASVKYLLEHTGLRPEGVVICEPTSLRIATGHRGRALILIRMQGIGCHASAPQKGRNPVYLLEPIIGRVQSLADRLAALPGEHGSVALTNIYCTTASNNSVPQDATLVLDRRLALGETEELIGQEMDALVAGTEAQWCFSDIPATSWRGQAFVFHSFLPAWELPQGHPLAQQAARACEEVLGKPAALFKLGCSTNGVTTAGVFNLPTIVLGPGDLAVAHARDEYCPVQDLVDACGIYARLCSGSKGAAQ